MALMVAGCGSESTPSAPSPALAAGEILYAPPGAGLAGATTFTFTAQGFSASNGDHLAYTWDFGDGTSVESGAAATHYYESAGTYVVSVVATGSGGLSAAASLDGPRVVSLSGWWGVRDGSGTLLAGSTYLTQDGPALRGTQIFDCPYDVRGTIVMPRSIRINWSRRWPECGYGESGVLRHRLHRDGRRGLHRFHRIHRIPTRGTSDQVRWPVGLPVTVRAPRERQLTTMSRPAGAMDVGSTW